MATSRSFSFLAEHDPVFLQLASTAEQVFAADPNTTLIKLRQLAKAFRGELVPQDPADEPAAELLKRLAASRAEAPKARRGRKSAAPAG